MYLKSHNNNKKICYHVLHFITWIMEKKLESVRKKLHGLLKRNKEITSFLPLPVLCSTLRQASQVRQTSLHPQKEEEKNLPT